MANWLLNLAKKTATGKKIEKRKSRLQAALDAADGKTPKKKKMKKGKKK